MNYEILSIRFAGKRQSIECYGRQRDQDSQIKHEFKTPSYNPLEHKTEKAPAKDEDDIDLFGDEDEEESELTKQRLAEYAERKAKSKRKTIVKSRLIFSYFRTNSCC